MSRSIERTEVIVIGAGAAGLMAAIFAASAGARVLLLERTRDGGRKILISGGGRCNVLPSRLDPGDYTTSSSANTLKKLLLSWRLPEQYDFFSALLGAPLVLEESSGKWFPASNRARDVRDSLVSRARAEGVVPHFGVQVEEVMPEGGGWRVRAEEGEWRSRTVVLATGGLSVPATGSDGAGLRIARQLGHTMHPTFPALTPLTATPPVHAALAGISLPVRLHAPAPGGPFTTRGGFLFTHRGYSGPAVLNISHLAVRSLMAEPRRKQPILVEWGALEGEGWASLLSQGGGGRVATVVRQRLPERLADQLLAEAKIDIERSFAQFRREERLRLTELLTRYPLPWTGDEGYRKAEVTGGGVALSEIDPGSLESRRQSGLFLCGEVLDAFGPIGGYNFTWAWATGRAAGLGAARKAGAQGGG